MLTILLAVVMAWPRPAGADVAAHLKAGCRLLVAGRWSEAGQAFRTARDEDPKCAEAFAGEGAASLLAGFQDAALNCFDKALILDPTLPAAHVGKATASYLNRDFNTALEDYRYVLAYDSPNRGAVRASEALVACMTGFYEMAQTEAQTALQEDPHSELALQVKAAALIARGRAGAALQVLSAPLHLHDQALGLLADSPLYSPRARYYTDHDLEDSQRLAALKGLSAPAPVTNTPRVGAGTVFNRGDESFHIDWPKPGAQVTGKVDLSVYAAPELQVQYIAVLIDDQFAGMSNSVPFHLVIDSTLARDGLREIRVDAYGPDGSIVKTASIMVNVDNAQRTLATGEQALRDNVDNFLEGLLVLRGNPLLRAQLAGHALEAVGQLQQAVDAYEYAFSYEPTLPCIRTDLILAYHKLGIYNSISSHEIHDLPGEGHVALTFDDGPHPVLTPWILNLLDEYHAKATFLLVGKQVEMYPELAREILSRGHEIGSHSYTHSNMRQLSELGVERELVMSRMIIQRACGDFVTLFRPPGGDYDAHVRAAVATMGFTTLFWNDDITYYKGQTAEEILPKMLHKIGRDSIVLLHNGHDETTQVLPLLLPALAARGLKMETISALTSHQPFHVQTPTIYPSDWKL